MTPRDSGSLNSIIGNVLRAGVLLSAAIIVIGASLLLASSGSTDVKGSLVYDPSHIPHGTFDTSLTGLLAGLSTLQPFSVIELGAIVLLSTPVVRVLVSVLLFAAEKDATYVYITAVVFGVLLFSIFVTPLIPGFNA